MRPPKGGTGSCSTAIGLGRRSSELASAAPPAHVRAEHRPTRPAASPARPRASRAPPHPPRGQPRPPCPDASPAPRPMAHHPRLPHLVPLLPRTRRLLTEPQSLLGQTLVRLLNPPPLYFYVYLLRRSALAGTLLNWFSQNPSSVMYDHCTI